MAINSQDTFELTSQLIKGATKKRMMLNVMILSYIKNLR